MGYRGNIVPGELPGYGAIFMANTGTKKECFQRKLFGLPLAQSDFVMHVKKGMILFLFEFEKRQLHGVFRATSNGDINIEPNAFRSSGKPFPAQVPFTSVWNCIPLYEHEFKDAIRDNYFSWKKFKFGLSKDQVYNLMTLFRSKRISKNNPPRTCLRFDDKLTERDTRFVNNRKKVRNRIRFIEEEKGHGFEIDEVKEIDDEDYKTLMKKRAHKDNKKVFLTKCKKKIDDFGDCECRKLDKHHDHTLGGLRRRVSDASLHFQCDIAYKNKYFRDDNRIKDEYHVINGIPNRGSQKIVDGWFFHHGKVESQQRMLTDHPLSKPKRVSTDVCQNPNFESRTSPFESRGEDIGIKLCSNEEFDLGNVNQYNSDFIPISEASEQIQNPFEFNNIENTYEHKFPNLTSCDPSLITTLPLYDPKVPDFFHRTSYFAPGCGSSPIDNPPIYPSETILSHFRKSRSKKYVRKASVFDRLNSPPKPLIHERDEKSELDSSVNKAMKMLEKIVSEEKQSTFELDEKNVDYYELLKKESNVKVEYEGIESIVEETRVVDFKRRKKTNNNFDDEFKENNTSGTHSDVGMCCKRRRLVRPVFVKKESAVSNDENIPLKVDCSLRKACESAKNIECQKGNIERGVCSQGEQEGIYGFDDMAWVDSSKYEHKMCGWIDE